MQNEFEVLLGNSAQLSVTEDGKIRYSITALLQNLTLEQLNDLLEKVNLDTNTVVLTLPTAKIKVP